MRLHDGLRRSPMKECSLCLAYLRAIGRAAESSPLLAMYGEELENLQLMEEKARFVGGAKVLQQLRAFYAVEALFCRCVYPMGGIAEQVDLEDPVPNGVRMDDFFSRSWEGLTRMLTFVKNVDRTMILEKTERELMSELDFDSMDDFVRKKMGELSPVLQEFVKAVTVLRRSLRGGSELHRIGRYFAKGLAAGRISLSDQIEYGKGLLYISDINPRSAWKDGG